MEAYGFNRKITKSGFIAELMKLYQKLIAKNNCVLYNIIHIKVKGKETFLFCHVILCNYIQYKVLLFVSFLLDSIFIMCYNKAVRQNNICKLPKVLSLCDKLKELARGIPP